jgi:hypothetical protein
MIESTNDGLERLRTKIKYLIVYRAQQSRSAAAGDDSVGDVDQSTQCIVSCRLGQTSG